MTERGSPMTAPSFRKLLSRLGKRLGFPFPIHPHMLRHSCGYKLVNDGHDMRSIQLKAIYSNSKQVTHRPVTMVQVL
ncbi:MAG: tyrosine-type recombinase/integrase [Cyanobacteria bacterium P01_H01_bin.153]